MILDRRFTQQNSRNYWTIIARKVASYCIALFVSGSFRSMNEDIDRCSYYPYCNKNPAYQFKYNRNNTRKICMLGWTFICMQTLENIFSNSVVMIFGEFINTHILNTWSFACLLTCLVIYWPATSTLFLGYRSCKITANHGIKEESVNYIAGFHMTLLKFKLQNYWSCWYFTWMRYKSSWKLIFTRIFVPNGFLAFVAKLSDKCSCWFPAAMLVPIRMGTNMVSSYKFL